MSLREAPAYVELSVSSETSKFGGAEWRRLIAELHEYNSIIAAGLNNSLKPGREVDEISLALSSSAVVR
jgi:hypothetical protein